MEEDFLELMKPIPGILRNLGRLLISTADINDPWCSNQVAVGDLAMKYAEKLSEAGV